MLEKQGHDLTTKIASVLADLYVREWDKFVMMTMTKAGKVSYITPSRKNGKTARLTMRLLYKHVKGEETIAVFAHKNSSTFFCFDVDDGSTETVKKVIEGLVEEGFDRNKIYVSTSGGKGYHVEVFFDRLMSLDLLKACYNRVCEKKELDTHKVEFRPTSTLAVKLPLSINKRTGNRCWFVNPETFEKYETVCYVYEIEKHSADDMWKDMYLKLPVYQKPKKEPTCLPKTYVRMMESDHYPVLTEPHTFRDTLCRIAVFIRKLCFFSTQEELRDELERWYRKQDQSLISESESEALGYIEGLAEWAWAKVDPLEIKKKRNGTVEYKKKDSCLTREDLSVILKGSCPARRWILFYLSWKEKSYGEAIVSHEKLASLLDKGTKQVIIRHMNSLKEAGLVGWKAGGRKVINGQIHNYANTYYVKDGEIDEHIPFLVEQVEIPDLETHDVKKTYYETLLQAINHKWLERHLQKDELTYITEELGYEL